MKIEKIDNSYINEFDGEAQIKVIQFNNEDSAERKIALYEKNIAELEN